MAIWTQGAQARAFDRTGTLVRGGDGVVSGVTNQERASRLSALGPPRTAPHCRTHHTHTQHRDSERSPSPTVPRPHSGEIVFFVFS